MSMFINTGNIDAPPAYAKRWYPIVPTGGSRYSKTSIAYLHHRSVPPCCPAARNPPDDFHWAPFVHPEGQPYFTRVLPEFRVVVDLNVHEPFQEFIDFWVKQMVDLVHMQENHLPAGALELYLEPHEHDPHQSCSYYLVSHSTRKVFWLEEVSSESLGMAPVVSDSHFDIALERLYWVHVEYFPNHITVEVPLHVLDDIILVLSHGQIDRMTSSTSTFPYTADKCEKMLGLLRPLKGQPPSGYLFCVMARVMGAIAHQRFTTFYGEGNAQLDRLQQVLPCDIVEYPRVTAICNLVMWGFPGGYLARLEELFLNNQVFADHWTDFMSSCLQDWSTSLSWAFPVLISSLVLSMVGGTSLSCAVPTILSCVASIASGSILHSRHQQLTNVSASAAVQYMGAAKMSSPMGLLPLAVVYSIPRASYFWGLCFIGMHFFVLLYHMVGTIGRLAVATSCALLVTLVCAVLWVSAPEEEQSFFGHILSLRPTLPFCGHGESYLHPPGAELEHMV